MWRVSAWSGVAEAYRTSFATLCEGTIAQLLADTPGRTLLDVGSGTGTLAARAAAEGRAVVAVDADPDMVSMSAAVVPGVVQAALPELPFPDGTFDAVTANFVVNHVPDPRAAVRELARVTRPGGRVAATIWTSVRADWASLVSDAFQAAGVLPVPGARLSPELDFERSPEGLSALCSSVGMAPVHAAELTWEWTIAVDALWAGIAGGVATAGQTFLAQTPAVKAATEREFHQRARDLSADGELRSRSTAAYVLAAPVGIRPLGRSRST